MSKVFFIIPNLNGKKLLEKSIPAAIKTIKKAGVEAEIIVIDNGSTDNSKEFIKSLIINEFSELMRSKKQLFNSLTHNRITIKLIENKGNYGFAKAVNQGIQSIIDHQSSTINHLGLFIVILNNDCVLNKSWLKEVLESANKNNYIAAVQGRNLTSDGKRIEGTGLVYFLKGKCLNRGNGELNNFRKYDREEEVFGVSAAAALYRLSALKTVGFFDEDFFAFEEDVDLALRLKMAGFKSFYNPKAIAYHIGGATVNKMGNLRARMDAKNWIFIILKDYPLKIIFRHFSQIFVERLRNLSGLIKRTIKIHGLWSLVVGPWFILETYMEVILKLPKMLKKRRGVQKDETIF